MLKNNENNKIFSIWEKENPNPKSELDYVNNYTFLVAVVLSAQSTDVGVNKATKKLFAIAKTPQEMINLGEEKLKKFINSIGLYNNKAKNIILLSKKLIEEFKSKIPDNLKDLQSLAGVGRKTANVILNSVFKKNAIAVDTHVFRVSNRIGFVNENDVFKTELSLLKTIPKKWQLGAHHWITLHGRYICKAIKPNCAICKINKICKYEKKNF
jgi:endonuclease-3